MTLHPEVDVLYERDALRVRVETMEATLASMDREVEQAFEHPEITFLTVCRIATLLWIVRDQDVPLSSGIRLARARPLASTDIATTVQDAVSGRAR